jgi:hydrogenase expression/formation protein HypE
MIGVHCPIPIDRHPVVTMAHGGGGRLMNQLVEQMFVAAFGSAHGAERHDGAVVPISGDRIAFSTDSFVVQPLVFPGGSIGALAVHGTANDLAMCGARPRYLSVGVILEEGLSMEVLWAEVQAMARTALEVGVELVTGDTKVVERGKGDGLFINTSGIGELVGAARLGPSQVRAGDAVLVSGDLGRHGMAVMAAREGAGLDAAIESDCGSLVAPALALLEAGLDVHCLRDLTRGGLASALNEVAAVSALDCAIDEARLRVSDAVGSACEIYGLDPLHVANEGRFAAWLPETQAARALEILRAFEISAQADRVGEMRVADGAPLVVARSRFGTSRVLDMLSGEQLPRIC